MREKEGEKSQCLVASCVPPSGDLVCNPSMCTDWALNGNSLVVRPALNSLSHTSQGIIQFSIIVNRVTIFLPYSSLPHKLIFAGVKD